MTKRMETTAKTTKTGRLLGRLRTSFVILLAAAVMTVSLTPLAVFASDPLTNHIEGWPQMSDINELTAVLMDADNGGILYSLDRDTKRHPASITKIMTCLLVLENLPLDDVVTMGQEALDVAIAGNSNINPILGESFTVEQCLYMLMLKSANDIAVQLAVKAAGSVEAFAAMMNERAAAIGCTGTHFNNPNGLPDPDHYTTAYDMALIMRECLKNSTFRTIIATRSYTVPATSMTPEPRYYENHNRLIDTNSEYYYPYCIGGKTGYTDAAMRTLICVASKDGKTLIGVTMGGADRSDFTDMARLFDYGFENFSTTDTSDNSGLTGSYTLPRGLAPNLTTEEWIRDSGGQTIYNYIYDGKIKVGELRNESGQSSGSGTASEDTGPGPDETGGESAGTGNETDGTENGTDGTGNGNGGAADPQTAAGGSESPSYPVITIGSRHINRNVLLAACAALAAVLIIICVAVSAHIDKKRREEARRRKLERRRREGRR